MNLWFEQAQLDGAILVEEYFVGATSKEVMPLTPVMFNWETPGLSGQPSVGMTAWM